VKCSKASAIEARVTLCAPPAPITHSTSTGSTVPGPLQAGEHAVVPLLQGRRRDAALHGTTKLHKPLGEDLRRAPLGQAPLKLPRAAHARERQLAHPSQARVEDPGATQMDRGRERGVDQPRPGEDLERPRLQRRGPGLAVPHRLALHNPRRHAVARQLGRGGQARRPGADHHHLGLSLAH
jgi:hypothetical protein